MQRLGGIGRVENRVAGHQNLGSGLHRLDSRGGIDAAVEYRGIAAAVRTALESAPELILDAIQVPRLRRCA